MTKEEHNNLFLIVPSHVFKASCLQDQSDRTLLLGVNNFLSTFHVYLKHGLFNIVVYRDKNILKATLDLRSIDLLATKDYMPNYRCYQDYCDYEFCSKMIASGVELTSFHFEKPYYKVESDGTYHGCTSNIEI